MLQLAYDALDDRQLNSGLVVALAVAADTLLDAENLGPITPLWPVIDAEPSAAVEFREMLTRRRRWVVDFDRCWGVFQKQLVGGFRDFLSTLPDSCFDSVDENETLFTVPLSSMIDDPGEAIEALIRLAYDDDTLSLNVFKALRARLGTNLLMASGFPPDANSSEVAHRLVMPRKHKSNNAGELVDAYLSGTPLEELLDTPVPFSVPESARFEHCHVIGGTGHGKTQLLQRMIHSDLIAAREDGRSVVVIDSQGDLIQKLVRLNLFAPDVPGSLFERLVLIDPADVEFPPSLNLFDVQLSRINEYGPADRERALNGLVELYETFFGALLGAELTQKQGVIFRYLARLMLVIPGATIHTLMQLMEDGRPFKEHMEKLDGSPRYFFETEFFHPSFTATRKQILRRLWGVLSTPAFERMFAQRENKVDLFKAMNEGKIVLINTAKDLLKNEGSALFGRFFIAMLAQATLERSRLPADERTPTFVYVDEAQEYFDDSIETILAQARKYQVGITLAHQTLDQLTPGLRSAFLSNTSLKCAGGVSSKDARALAPELRTTAEFIEGMRKRNDRSEFAVWLKHRTTHALRLDVPLGFLERQATLEEDAYDDLIECNRARYCGTMADVLQFERAAASREPTSPPQPSPPAPAEAAPEAIEAPPPPVSAPIGTPRELPASENHRGQGKGGAKHRYLQSLVKGLAEEQGFRATVEAQTQNGSGQVDVLLEREGLRVAVEVSVTTPADYERENVRKCLDAGFDRIAVVLAKAKAATQAAYKTAILDGCSAEERERISFLTPEDVPDYIASLAPPPEPTENIVKGYRVRVSRTVISPEEAKERRDRLAKLVAESLRREE